MIVGARRTQPFRKTVPRPKGATLTAMKRGKPALGRNPMDVSRATARMARRRKRGRALVSRLK